MICVKQWLAFFLVIGMLISVAYADEIHTLESNETVYQISQKYNIPLEILLNSNNISDPSHLPIGKKIRIPGVDTSLAGVSQSSVTHTVVNGDTLYSIAQKYNTDIQTLQNSNELSADDIIKSGMILSVEQENTFTENDVISSPTSTVSTLQNAEKENYKKPAVVTEPYIVMKGDTLYSIAEKYGTSIEYLQSVNDLSHGDIITPGHTLMIMRSNDGSETSSPVSISVANSQKYSSSSYDKLVISSPKHDGSVNIPIQAASLLGVSSHKRNKNVADKKREQDKGVKLKSTAKNNVHSSFTSPSSTLLLDRAIPFGVVSKKFPVKGTSYVLKTHSGVFIESDENSLVKAVESGRVLYIVPSHGTFRNILVIQSKSGEIFVYGCQQAITVKQGDFVTKGQMLGRVGIMPLAQKPVLYFAVFKKDKFINPKKFLL